MMNLIDLWCKYKKIILYLIFGACTTFINIITYFLFKSAGFNITVSSVLSWILSVLFAYITNKLCVFESKQSDFIIMLKEIISFASGRITTGILDLIIVLICVGELHFNELIVKIVSNIIVIVLNYIISKLLVFKIVKK